MQPLWTCDQCPAGCGAGPPGGGLAVGALAGLGLAVDVRFEVDDTGDGDGLADAGLGGVDRGGDLAGRVVVLDGDLGGDEQFLGAEVERAHVDDAGDGVAVDDRGLDLLDRLDAGGLAEQQGLGLDRQDEGDEDEQDSDAEGADAVPDAVTGEQGQADTAEGEDQADECAEVLQEDDRELGGLGAAHELLPGEVAAQRVGLLDGRPEGEALGDDREDEDAHWPVPVFDLVRVLDLLVALVDGEHAADREEHDGHQEGVDVALAAVAEGVLRGGLALGLLAAEEQQELVSGVGERVHALGEHRGRAAERERHELRCRDREVGAECRHDRPGSA
ncbi:hypothetical protein M2162_004964 [Streptomyces sp. SAI-041]|nr:hypothetical protein [Streptomyces sp. SAI-041]